MRICCASQSELADDPRVRNQVEALRSAGHDVVVVAYVGGRSAPLDEPTRLIDAWPRTVSTKLMIAAQVLGGRAIRSDHLDVFKRLPGSLEFEEAVTSEPADLYIANDWRALPAAYSAAKNYDARFAYDAAEWSVGEFIERRSWRLIFPPLIRDIEARFLPDAAFVSTVGPGLAQLFRQAYCLRDMPLVIRNLPLYQKLPLREPGSVIKVLYHGQFLPNRGLEQLIRSIPMWPQRHRLLLRGSGPGRYEQHLRLLARSIGVADRVEFCGPVRMTDLVRLANHADVGIHPLQDASQQTRYSLPNKLFEYIMAGLALCVADLPDMRAVVNGYDVGTTIRQTSPQGIAEALHYMSTQKLLEFKRNSLNAAVQLNWAREQDKLISAVDLVSR